MSLAKILRHFEPKLWQGGLIGYAIRGGFRRAWMKISWIPPRERLWRALNKPDQIYKDGKPKPSFFRDRSGLSVDIARFTTAERSRIGNAEKPYPAESGLIEIEVGWVRSVGSDVAHVPVTTPRINYAHAQLTTQLDATGEDKLAQAARFRVAQRFKVASGNRSK